MSRCVAGPDAPACAFQVYGKGTETLVMDEDAQTLEARPSRTQRDRAPLC